MHPAGRPSVPSVRPLLVWTSIAWLAAGIVGCQRYDPATVELCARACEQRKECEPAEFARQFTHERECQLACQNDWLKVGRYDTPACERAFKQEFVCVAELDCAALADWRAGEPEDGPGYPCQRQSLTTSLACAYECVADDDCHGWERCQQGACLPRACQQTDDCPAGIWCVAGECRPI